MLVCSGFTLKIALFWLSTKSKVQNVIYFFISHSHSSLLIPSLLVCMTSSVYSTMLWTLWLFLVNHFCVIGYICLTCIIVYVYCHGLFFCFVWWIFFFYLYIFVLLFFFLVTQVIYIYIYIKLTIMVINIKLVIGHYILKSIPAQNRPNCTAHMTAKLKFDVMMVLTKLHYKVLTKKIQNYTKLHCKYPYVKPINIQFS